MKDLIYRQAAIDELMSEPSEMNYGFYYAGKIEALPSAQTEIIYCKDCKYRQTDDCPMCHEEWIEYDDDGYLEHDYIVHDNTKDNGFCDRGERREE